MKHSPAKAYSPLQIGISACLGGPLAGAWLLLQTRQVFGRAYKPAEHWLTGLVVFGFIFTLFALLPIGARTALAGLPALASGISCACWAKQTWGGIEPSSLPLDHQGTWWGAIGRGISVGLLSLAVLSAVYFAYQILR
jgi:hypothetical protein